jgi:hypothetical protein
MSDHHHLHHQLMHVASLANVCWPENTPLWMQLVARAGWLPYLLFVIDFFLAAIWRRPYFFFAKLVVFIFWFRYLQVLAKILHVERQRGFDYELCGASRFALPDAVFVSTLVYLAMMLIGFWMDTQMARTFMTRWNIFVISMITLCYVASTIITGYFSWMQLALNSGVAVFVAISTLVIYRYAVHCYEVDDDEWWLKTMFGRLARLANVTGPIFFVDSTRQARHAALTSKRERERRRRRERKNLMIAQP